MTFLLRFFKILFVLFLWNGFIVNAQIRNKQTINSHWVFSKDRLYDAGSDEDLQGTIVSLPHTWNDKDVLSDGKRGYYRGIGWYEKTMNVNIQPEKNYYLHFEGANQYTEVYVNHKKAGTHSGGYTAFTFDITPFLMDGQNKISVKVDNSHHPDIPPLSADFTFFGGIYRDVHLIETSKISFDLLDYGASGLFITTDIVQKESAHLTVKGNILNQLSQSDEVKIIISMMDHDQQIILKELKKIHLQKERTDFEWKLTVPQPKLWSPDAPNRYQIVFQIQKEEQILDEERINYGIRDFYFDADKGFFLNGKHLKLIGANRHQDYPGQGNALSDAQHREDLKLLKEMGANFVRLAHYPQAKVVLEEADRLGLLVWEEIPLVNEISLSEDHHRNAEQMLREMIRQHYNHPSVIMWGYMNEIFWMHRYLPENDYNIHKKETIALAKRLEALARAEDQKRYTAMAMHYYELYDATEIGDITQIASWNLYQGWYYDEFEDFGRFLDEQKRKYPHRIHFVSEFGAGGDPRLHSLEPEKYDFTISYQKQMMESYLRQIMDRDYLSGAAVWSFIDFSSEGRRESQPHFNNKGLLTSEREKKDAYYWFQANLSEEPMVKIAETNWKQRIGVQKYQEEEIYYPIIIYTNEEEAELFLNDKSLGKQSAIDKRIVWKVRFENDLNQLSVLSYPHLKKDELTVTYREIPFSLKEEKKVDLQINCGNHSYFYDEKEKELWIPDQAYQKGSWGYVGGEKKYFREKIGSNEDVFTAESLTPLFQTMHEGASHYQFDVADGYYEIELLFIEPYPKARNITNNNLDHTPKHKGGTRIFDVWINDMKIFSQLDLVKQLGYNYPLREKFIVRVTEGKGLQIRFKEKKNRSIISGIRIRSS